MQIDLDKILKFYGESQLENKLLLEQIQLVAKENSALKKELDELKTPIKRQSSKPSK